MKTTNIAFLLLLNLFFTCNHKKELTQIELDSLLESMNTEDILIIGSPAYKKFTIQNELRMDQRIVSKEELNGLLDAFGAMEKVDSLYFDLSSDSVLEIHSYEYNLGCFDVLPYYNYNDDTLFINYYKAILVEVDKQNGEVTHLSSSCENVRELTIRLSNVLCQEKILVYRGSIKATLH